MLLSVRDKDGNCCSALRAAGNRQCTFAHKFKSFTHIGKSDVRVFNACWIL